MVELNERIGFEPKFKETGSKETLREHQKMYRVVRKGAITFVTKDELTPEECKVLNKV